MYETTSVHPLKDGSAVRIREATPKDLVDIWRIFRSVTEEKKWIPVLFVDDGEFERLSWFSHHKSVGSVILVAEIEKKVVGHCLVERDEWDAAAHVGNLGIMVNVEHRGRGVGSAMIKEAIIRAREKGFEKICLSTFNTNLSAIRLYKKHNFQIIGVRRRQFKMEEEYKDEVLMELILDN
ncbi:MAG: GNAT family N-acetyltransferase [Candidatus Jordarchaeum sp.]|uniref:GNAT family N-acetyltransferase n=1 Tax=Candidatus Jordarchaeum sp. TaxID=2823881 RepID=UPI0040495EDF